MSYSTGILKHRLTIQNRSQSTLGRFGKDSGGIVWEDTCTVWAAVDFSRGTHSMREGALDAYEVIVVRMRWTDKVNMRSRVKYQGNVYQILPGTFHTVFQDNIIQFNAQLIVDGVGSPYPDDSSSK